MVSKCGEGSGDAVQLAVLRALLTIATADHFLVHGDCLMQVNTPENHLSGCILRNTDCARHLRKCSQHAAETTVLCQTAWLQY